MDGQLLAKVAEAGLGWAIAAYLGVLLLREKDKRIKEAQELKRQDRKILQDIRKLVDTLNTKAKNA